MLERVPVFHKFILMHFGPGFNQTPLAPEKGTRHHLDRINAENPDVLLMVSVKVRDVMLCADLCKHTNNDSEEPAYFRHGGHSSREARKTEPRTNLRPFVARRTARTLLN